MHALTRVAVIVPMMALAMNLSRDNWIPVKFQDLLSTLPDPPAAPTPARLGVFHPSNELGPVLLPDRRPPEVRKRVDQECSATAVIVAATGDRAWMFLEEGRFQDAVATFYQSSASLGIAVEALFERAPDQAALVLIHNGRASEAAEIMANRQGGSSVSAVVTALAYSEAGRFEDAKRAFDPAMMIDDYIPAESGYRRDDSTPAQLKADILLATGICMFFHGREELADVYLRWSYELDDGEPLTVLFLGKNALRLDEPEDALAYIEAVLPHFSGSMANVCRAAQELAHDAIRKKRRAGG